MNKTNENAVQDQDVIVLGVASTETHGGPGGGELEGFKPILGISED